MSRAQAELTAELVVDGRVPSSPVMSPDGRWVAYVVAPVGQVDEHPLSQLWITAVDGSAPPRRLDLPPACLSSPRWAPDSDSLFFLSDQAVRGTAQLYRIGRVGGSPQALTNWTSGLHAYRPMTDPALVAIIAPDEPTEHETRREQDRDDAQLRGSARPARLRLLDLRTGRIRTPATFGDRHVVDVVQRPDGGPLAVLTWPTPDLDPGLIQPALHLLDVHTGGTRDIGPAPDRAHSPAWWHGRDWHLTYLASTPPGFKPESPSSTLWCATDGLPGHIEISPLG